MKKYLLFSIFAFISIISFSQEKKLLQDYKFRIDYFKALDVIFGAQGNSSRAENFSTNSNGNIGGNIGLRFNTIKSSDNFFQISSSNLQANAYSSKSTNYNNQRNSSQYNFKPSVHITNSWFKKNNFYLEIGGTFDTDFNNLNSSNKGTGNSIENKDAKEVNASVNIGIGTGRIENIIDMQNAIWINKILSGDGNFNRVLTNEEIIGLAKTISTANNFRILDGRRRIKFVLKKVDEYLQSKSVITKTDIDYFSNLNDIIFFANNFSRKTGSTKFIKIIPTLDLKEETRSYINIRDTKSTYENNRTALNLKIGIENFNPLGLKHQIDYGIAANLSIGDFKITSSEVTNNSITNDFVLTGYPKIIFIDYFVEYNFYPNTRTNIGCNLVGNFGFVKGSNGNDFTNALAVKINANYFISYNTRLVFNLITDYNQYSSFKNSNQSFNGNQLNFNISAGLNVAL